MYTRGELGLSGDADEPVTVNRTTQTLSHPETLASLRGAFVTVGHPPDGVTPSNFQDVVVGSVAGEPRVQGDIITGDLLVGDREALKRLDAGEDELSIGYSFALGSDNATIGPLRINHVAIVPRGRAGSSVRVLDHETIEGGDDMPLSQDQISEITDAVGKALDEGMQRRRMGDASDAGYEKAMRDALAPVMDEFNKMKATQDAAITAADAAKVAADAKAAGDKLVELTRAEERERFAVLTDAMPLIAEDKRAALMEAEPKAILVAALGDSIPNADTMSVDYLRGALAVAKVQEKNASNQSGGSLPAGVKAFDGARNVTATDARAQGAGRL